MNARTVARSRALRRALLASAVACCFGPPVLHANPTGPAVTAGHATFSRQGPVLTVTNTPGSIINWQSFSIGAGETTRFVQQSAASTVLNRVIGADASSILGTLQSNGRVFLINPAGIMIGHGAVIDVAGFVASTLQMADADFLQNRMRFQSGPIVSPLGNAGEIRTPLGGRVLLVGSGSVENSGVIRAPGGEVVLAAGRTVELIDAATPAVRVEVSAPDSRAVNLGEIVAHAGRVGLYAGAIRQAGVVSADSAVVGESGRIEFRATRSLDLDAGSRTSASGAQGGTVTLTAAEGTTLVAGEVRATGTASMGGSVQVLGERVGVVGDALIDASGAAGGGTVLVGGGLQGRDASVQNAQFAYVGPNATIRADATDRGDGGTLIVWADDSTRVHGSLSARGGPNGGNGGFVETSAKRALEVTRAPDVRAPNGAGGTWLLDPADLRLIAGGGLVSNLGAPFFSPLADSSTIDVALINAQLDFGSNVFITTTSQGDGPTTQVGNITVSAPIVKTANFPNIGSTSFQLRAHGSIVIESGGSITSTGSPLSVDLRAAQFGSTTGSLTVNAPISTAGGSVTLQAADAVAVNASITSGSGSVNLTSTNGTITVAAPVTTSNSSFNATALRNLTIAAPISTGFGGVNLTVNDTTGASILTIAPGGSATGGSAFLQADDMAIQGPVNTGAGTINLRARNSARPISLGTDTAGSLGLTAGELANFSTTGSLSIGTTFGNGAVTQSAPISFAGTGTFSVASTSSITQSAGAGLMASGTLVLDAPSVTLAGASSANRVIITADTLAVDAALTSANDIDVTARSFNRPVKLGVGSLLGGALELTSAQLNNFSAPGFVRFNTQGSSGVISIEGPIAPTFPTLSLIAGASQITQAAGATVTVQNLAARARGVNLPENNAIGTVAGTVFCCSGTNFLVRNAAGNGLTVGTVDSSPGITNTNANRSITLVADSLSVGAGVSANSSTGIVTVRPSTPAQVVDLGGADGAGVLGLSAGELAQLSAAKVVIETDQANVSAPVAFANGIIGNVTPLTAGRAVNIVSGAKNPANLELTAAEIGNLAASTFVLGGGNAGPLSVNAPVTVPASITSFQLHTSETVSGLAINAVLTADNDVRLVADKLTLGAAVSSTGAGVAIQTATSGRAIDLGTASAGALGIAAADFAMLSAPNGSLSIVSASGNVTFSQPLTLTSVGALNVSTGGSITVGASHPLSVPGPITLDAATVNVNAAVTNTGSGNVDLIANTLAIGAGSTITSSSGDITVRPRTFRNVDLGGADGGSLALNAGELALMTAPAGRLAIGDTNQTGNITVSASVTMPNVTAVSLRTDNGAISQNFGATVTAPQLAAHASDAITLDQQNVVGTVALRSDFGDVSFKRAAGGDLTVGTVGGISGITAGAFLCCGSTSTATISADRLILNDDVVATTINLRSTSPGRTLDLGTNSAGVLGFSQSDLDRLQATSVDIGDFSSGSATISAPVTATSFSGLSLTTSPSASVNVANALSAGSLFIATGTLTTTGDLTATSGPISLLTDSMTLGGAVSVTGGISSIGIRGVSANHNLNLGGSDGAGVLGIDATDLSRLSANSYTFSTLGTGSITTTAPLNFGTSSFTLRTEGASGSITVGQPLTTTGNVELRTDSLALNAMLTAGNLTLRTLSNSRNVDIGGSAGGTLALDTTLLSRIDLGGTGRLVIDTGTGGSAVATVSQPVSLTQVHDLTIQAPTLNVQQPLSTTGDVTLLANTMDIAAAVSAGSGHAITVAPLTSSNMTVGPTTGAGLVISQAEIGQLMTTGAVRLGSTQTTSTLSVGAPITQGGSASLTLAAGGAINQAAGATITASNLRLHSSNSFTNISLTEANQVGTLAGSSNSSSSFAFTNAAPLTIGAVDGASGLAGGSLTLRADALTLSNGIANSSTTIAPRTAGVGMDLGSKPGGVLGLTDAELALVTGNTLSLGNNTTGPITVSAPVSLSRGSLSIVAAPTQTVNLNAALSNSGNVTIDAGTINVSSPLTTTSFGSVNLTARAPSTLNVNAAISAESGIQLISDATNINASVTSEFGSITVRPFTAGRPIDLGSKPGTSLGLTAGEIGLLDASTILIGNSSAGPMTIGAPISVTNAQTLSLQSGGAITQTPGSTITVNHLSGTTPVGTLQVFAGGNVSLKEANRVDRSLSGSASGSGSDFDFVNTVPMRIQNVSVSDNATGQERIGAGTFIASGAPLAPEILQVVNLILSETQKAGEATELTEQKAETDKQKQQEEERKSGKRPQQCS